eukprot:TRINITY_DN48002_c0_g1_i1.p1 TRINITY_DN48002_c0_g1~~TRINITY_DN48002_c0_g1_i1.p1  ORF type:complete len:653 (-),score=119.54 TRINITY_DN48002_c0_g1_i1:63-1985(-)
MAPELLGNGGHLLVALVSVLFSTHLWAARCEVEAAMHRVTSRLFAARKAPSRSKLTAARYKSRWQEAKITQFKSVTAAATHAAGLVLLVFLVCTDVLSKISLGQLAASEFPLFAIFAVNYACVLLNYITLDSVTSRRIDLFYVGTLTTACASVLYIETGPFFFMFRSNDALAQGMLALVVLDIRRSSVGGAVYAACCCVSYLRNVSAFREHLHVDRHAQLFIFWEFAIWIFCCGVAYAAEAWLKASIWAKMETEDLQDGLDRVLSALCDAVLHLNTDLLIQSPSQRLVHMLVPNTVGGLSELQGQDFTSFLSSEEDRNRFRDFILLSSSRVQSSGRPPAAAARVRLRDMTGNVFHVELFHTYLQGNASVGHVIGVRYCEDKYDSSQDLVGMLNMPSTDFSRLRSSGSAVPELGALSRVDAESSVGAPTLAQQPWRCTRCGATRQDWGDAVSVSSGIDDNESLRRGAPGLRAEMPPSAGQDQVDRQTITSRFTALHQLDPELCREVLSQTQATYSTVHSAAASLQDEEEAREVQELKTQVLEHLLVGHRLELRWPGLRPMWCQVIAFTTGAEAVPMLKVPGSDAQGIVTWKLPTVHGTCISPAWWELGPQGIYNRVRAAVLNRMTMPGRGPGGGGVEVFPQ